MGCTAIKLRAALERAGIEFTNGTEPGVGLRKSSAQLDVNREVSFLVPKTLWMAS